MRIRLEFLVLTKHQSKGKNENRKYSPLANVFETSELFSSRKKTENERERQREVVSMLCGKDT